jgi:hypothetical protein
MRFRYTKRIGLGPVRISLSRSGASTTIYPLWPLTRRVSWSSRTRKITVDTPGPGSLVTERRVGLPAALAGLTLMAALAVTAAAVGWILWGDQIHALVVHLVDQAHAAASGGERR